MMVPQDIDLTLQDALLCGESFLPRDKVADYIPELTEADPSHLKIYSILPGGNAYRVGDWNVPFTIQGTTKIFPLILALEMVGYEKVFSKVGMEPTGSCFDSVTQSGSKQPPPFDPMINTDAIVTINCIDLPDPFEVFLDLVHRLCFHDTIRLNKTVCFSKEHSGLRNRSVAYLLQNDYILEGGPEQILDRCFRMCSVEVTMEDLARYALILVDDDLGPVIGSQMIDEWIVRIVKTLMLTCGMRDESREFTTKVGIPPKSRVGGGVIAAAEQGMGAVMYGPVLSKKRDSTGGVYTLEYLPGRLNLYSSVAEACTAV